MWRHWIPKSFCSRQIWPLNWDPDWTKVKKAYSSLISASNYSQIRSLINPSGGSSGGGVISLGRSGDTNKVVTCHCNTCIWTNASFTLHIGGLQCYLSLHAWLWWASIGKQGLGASESGQCQHQTGGTGDKMLEAQTVHCSTNFSGSRWTGNIWGAPDHRADF